MRRMNPERAGRSLGARARKNPGTPMVSVLIRVRCRGRNGKGTPATPTARASSIAYTVLVRNRFPVRSTLAITRRPPATAGGGGGKEESRGTDRVVALEAGLSQPP